MTSDHMTGAHILRVLCRGNHIGCTGKGRPRGTALPPTVTAWSIRILCSLIELDGSEKAREGTACRSGTSAEEEHNNDAVRAFVGDRVR